jgi:hypothetical protein
VKVALVVLLATVLTAALVQAVAVQAECLRQRWAVPAAPSEAAAARFMAEPVLVALAAVAVAPTGALAGPVDLAAVAADRFSPALS